MTLLTTAYLLERYGPLLDEDQVGQVLHISGKTVRNQRSLGAFPLKGKKEGSRILFHAADVAALVDSWRAPVQQR